MHSVSAWCELKNSIVSINIKIVLCLLQTEGTVKSFFGGSVAHDGAMSLEDAPACSHLTSLIVWLSRHVLYAQTHLATADLRYGFWDGSPPQFLVSPNPAIASAKNNLLRDETVGRPQAGPVACVSVCGTNKGDLLEGVQNFTNINPKISCMGQFYR